MQSIKTPRSWRSPKARPCHFPLLTHSNIARTFPARADAAQGSLSSMNTAQCSRQPSTQCRAVSCRSRLSEKRVKGGSLLLLV